jgi:hypothetical protein
MDSESCTWWGLEEVSNPLHYTRHNVLFVELTSILLGSVSSESLNRLAKHGIKLVNAIATTE